MNISDEAVEEAAREFYGTAYDDVAGEELQYVLNQMRDALEAAGPYLMAELAEAWWMNDAPDKYAAWKWLRDRAGEVSVSRNVAEAAWDEAVEEAYVDFTPMSADEAEFLKKRNPYRSKS